MQELKEEVREKPAIRQDVAMPVVLPTPEGMPKIADNLQKAFGNTPRILVLRFLLGRPDSTRNEIVEGTGLRPGTIYSALRELEEYTLISAQLPEGERNGRHTTYRADRQAVSSGMVALSAWLFSSDD